MYPRWAHWRGLNGACPVCGKPAHVGTSEGSGRAFWLHDKYDMREHYRGHGVHGLVEVDREEFRALLAAARERGDDPSATRGGVEAVSKRVRCVETGRVYPSIQAAADASDRSRASLSCAIKRGGTCAGRHWELV